MRSRDYFSEKSSPGFHSRALPIGGALAAQQRPPDSIPASVGDLKQAQLIEVRDSAGQVLLHGTFKTDDNKVKETERSAKLESPSGQAAKGKVSIEIERKDGLITKDEIKLEVENLPTMANCAVVLDGQTIAEFVTTKKGKAEIKLSRKSS